MKYEPNGSPPNNKNGVEASAGEWLEQQIIKMESRLQPVSGLSNPSG